MRRFSPFPALMLVVLATALATNAQAPAPAWQTATELPNVDFSGLSAARKSAALKLMREYSCSCGCNMKVAQCRIEDPACTYSQGIAGLILKGFKDGKTADEVTKIVSDSAVGRPHDSQKILEDPVQIQIAGSPSLGPPTARILLVEFSDFECPYCAKATQELHQILTTYPKDIRLVYKQFPLTMHPHAFMASLAALAAFDQGKFWEMHDKMFANYRSLSPENLLAWAKELGLDPVKFKASLDSPKNRAIVKKDLQDGEFAGVNGTPALFINGKHYNGPVDLGVLKPIFDEELKTAHPASRP